MPYSFKRELEVAFSKHSQPMGFRIGKYIVLGCLIYLLWDNKWFWPVLGALLALSVLLHIWYSYKTKGWNQSYGMWDYEKNKPKQNK